MIGYAASVNAFELKDANSVHDVTYTELKNATSAAEYRELTEGNQYREIMANNPQAFAEQLPFYKIRILYTFLIFILGKLGMNIFFATHFISGLAVAGGIILLYVLGREYLPVIGVYGLALFILVFKVFELARYSTPDGLAFLAITLLMVFSSFREKTKAVLILLPIMVIVRTDLVLISVPIYIILFMRQKRDALWIILSSAGTLLSYLGLNFVFGNPGWATTFYVTMVGYVPFPISKPPTLSAALYFESLWTGLRALAGNKRFLLYLSMLIFSFILTIKMYKKTAYSKIITEPFIGMLCIGFIYFVGHFALFPVSWDRFFTGIYMTGVFSLFLVLAEYQKSQTYSAQHPS